MQLINNQTKGDLKMNKMELRVACKQAGIKNYGKMTNEQMTKALAQKEKETYNVNSNQLGETEMKNEVQEIVNQAPEQELGKVESPATPTAEKEAEKLAKAEAKAKAKLEKQAAALEAAERKKAEKEAKAEAKAKAKAEAEAKKVLAKMPEQNGIRRPKPETLCGQVWQVCDSLSEKIGKPVSIKAVLEACPEDFNVNNIRTEYARWKKFNGITGKVD